MENNLNNLLYSIKDKVSKYMENKYQKPSTIINNFYCEASMNTRSFTDHIVKSLVKK